MDSLLGQLVEKWSEQAKKEREYQVRQLSLKEYAFQVSSNFRRIRRVLLKLDDLCEIQPSACIHDREFIMEAVYICKYTWDLEWLIGAKKIDHSIEQHLTENVKLFVEALDSGNYNVGTLVVLKMDLRNFERKYISKVPFPIVEQEKESKL